MDSTEIKEFKRFCQMNLDDINLCMNVMDCLEDDAEKFFKETVKYHKVTQDGPWCKVSWFKEMCSKYLKTGATACGAGALAASAEFTGASKGISGHIYLRLWVLTADTPLAVTTFANMGSLGSRYSASVKSYVKSGPAKIVEDCDYKRMPVDTALSLMEFLEPEDAAQNRLMEYVADADEDLLPLAQFIRYKGGVMLNEFPAI